MPYLGKTPSQATRQRYYLTASGGETSISGTMTTGGTLTFNDGEFVDVKLNGVSLVAGTDYNTTTANTIGGLSALSANDQVEIVVYDTFSVFGGNVDGDFTVNNGTVGIGTDAASNPLTVRGDGGTGTTAAIRIRDESDQGATFGIQNDGDLVIVAETKDVNINTNNGNVRVEDGNLVIATAGKGIDFSATSDSAGSMGSELLDDYEEGTWTPAGAASSGTAASFDASSGTYTKIGRLVTINASITNITAGGTSNAQIQVTGLPFTPDVQDGFGACNFGQVTITDSIGLVAVADASENRISFFMNRTGAGRTGVDNQHISSGVSDALFTISYITSQ